ncbi:hypothetical protein DFH09DRAFT_1264948 [Mycena vulgaris]|nr:hypothetical protein DFH09DRAFT_1264948 [Mycena vulgaris]
MQSLSDLSQRAPIAVFQVASHPQSPAFPAPSYRDQHRSRPRYHNAPSLTPGALSLPRTLARPPFTEVMTLLAAAPELSGVPAEFIRHGLRAKAPQMLAGIAAPAPSHLPTSLPRMHLPAKLTFPLRCLKRQAQGGERDAAHAIFLVHAVVLAAHCAKFPGLSLSALAGSSRRALPVLPLPLPSPHAFAILHDFMYTHCLAPALAALLPLTPAFLPSASSHGRSGELTHATLLATRASPLALHPLALHLCAVASSSALMGHAEHVKELWQDMVALGVYDPELWDARDLAWEVVLGALNLAAQ